MFQKQVLEQSFIEKGFYLVKNQRKGLYYKLIFLVLKVSKKSIIVESDCGIIRI